MHPSSLRGVTEEVVLSFDVLMITHLKTFLSHLSILWYRVETYTLRTTFTCICDTVNL